MATANGRESPPPNYNSLNFALRVPRGRRQSSSRVRRLQITLVVGNWVGIIAFIISSAVICVPVLSDDLSYPLKTTIRVLGYILMGVVAFGMLFLNCVIRRTIIQEFMRQNGRRRRQVSSINVERGDLPPCPPGFLPIAAGQPGAYIGPCNLDPKEGPLGLPDYETAVAQSPPSYVSIAQQQSSASQDRPCTSNDTNSEVPSNVQPSSQNNDDTRQSSNVSQ